MKKFDARKLFAIIINISIIFMEIFAFVDCFKLDGIKCFQYYTQDSNLFLMISCILYLIVCLANKEKKSRFISLLKYSSTVSVTVTFLVVVTILAPVMGGYKAMMFDGTMLYHHLLCPILGFVSFIFLEDHEISGLKDALLAMIFTVIYGIIAVILNILGIMDGPYPFLKVYEQSLLMSVMWVFLMNGSNYLLNIGIAYLNNLFNRKAK